jgi:hypothetical protein
MGKGGVESSLGLESQCVHEATKIFDLPLIRLFPPSHRRNNRPTQNTMVNARFFGFWMIVESHRKVIIILIQVLFFPVVELLANVKFGYHRC